MKVIAKYLKTKLPYILAAFLLIGVQVWCDLSLPTSTARIVNVGLSQGGIEEALPQVLSSSEFEALDKLSLGLAGEIYTPLKPSDPQYSNIVDSFPLAAEGAYVLSTSDEEGLAGYASSLSTPMLLLLMGDLPQGTGFSLPPEQAQMLSTLRAALPSMSDGQVAAVLEKAAPAVGALSVSVLKQAVPLYIKSVYQGLGADVTARQIGYIVSAGAQMLGIVLISVLAAILCGYMSSRIGAGLAKDLRQDVFGRVLSFSPSEFDKFSTASLITRSTNDIQQIQMMTIMSLRMVAYAPIMAVGGIMKVLNTNVSMAWIIGLAVVSIGVLIGGLFSLTMPKFKLRQILVDKLNLISRETLTGLSVIRAFGTEEKEKQRFNNASEELRGTNLFVNRAMSVMMPLMNFVMNVVTLAIVWVGAGKVDLGVMQVGDLTAFISYAMQIIMSFLMISMISVSLPAAMVSIKRVAEILTTDSSIKDPQQPAEFLLGKKGWVELDHVSFKYPGAEHNVLTDISFTAKPGQTTAIIGATGSGKSTVINLIPRFFDVSEGRVLVEGVDVRDVPQRELRAKIGLVPQKGVLFSGTIESNIGFGPDEPDEERIALAARIAQAEEFIKEKPEGLLSPVAQGGTNVSGGQKQRLAIARALNKQSPIYIFDDSFSALDYKTDIKLRKALNEHTGHSTIIIVAQRISTVLNADQIIVLADGQIAGIGSHRQLMESCEEYRQIALSQLSKEELANG